MLPRLLTLAFLAAMASAAPSAARLMPIEAPEFEVYGLEQLTGRYGAAYPGYENWGQQVGVGQQIPISGISGVQRGFGVGGVTQRGLTQQQLLQQQQLMGGMQDVDQLDQMDQMDQMQMQQQMQQPMQFGGVGQNIGQQNIGMMQQDQFGGNIGVNRQMLLQNAVTTGLGQQRMMNIGTQQFGGINTAQLQGMDFGLGQQGVLPTATFGSTATQVLPAYGAGYGVPTLGAVGANIGFGGVGAFGAGTLGTSKKTTTAQPIYAQSMVVPKIITQPILRPHSVTQPILQQQLIQQPIVETRQVIQPVIRRIITQPIIRPEIYESTTIQPTLKTETTVQPHIVQQTVVTPTLMNQYEEQQPIQEQPKVNIQAPVVQPTISGKKTTGALGYAQL